jgi:peptide/nickel transport system substrate-binding protein
LTRIFIIFGAIVLIFFLAICGTLERQNDHPRFHLETPVPVDADTAYVGPGIYGGRVLVPANGDPKTFNPLVASETSSTVITSRLFAGLVNMDNVTQELIPGLAKSWDFSDDNLTLTFHLRRGLLWSDGIPLTAYDCEFTFRALYDPNVENSLADILRVNGEPFVYAALDSLTFQVSIPSTFAPFLMWAGGAVPVLPRHILEPQLEAGTFDSAYNISWPVENLMGSGPYLIEKYNSGVKIALRSNPAYWRVQASGSRLPFLDRIIHVITPSTETSMLMFQTGDLDMIGINKLSDVPILERDAEKGNYTVENLGASMGQIMFWFNLNPGSTEDGRPFVAPHKQKWFNDVRFRKAMAHAVDRDGIANTVFGGLAVPMWGPETPANKFWYNPDLVRYKYDLDRAGEYLDDMGLLDRDGDGIREDEEGNPVAFTMVTNTGNDQRELMGNIIKDDLSRIGVDMNFNPIEFNTLIVKISNDFEYDCCLLGLTSGDPDPSSGMSVWLSSGRMHQWYPNQPEPATEWEARIDELMNLQMTTLDRDRRKEYYDEVQYIISDMAPYVYLVTPQVFVTYRNEFKNLVPTILQHTLLWDIEAVWKE